MIYQFLIYQFLIYRFLLLFLWQITDAYGNPFRIRQACQRSFIADRPFVFALVEMHAQTILMLGQKVQ